LKLAKLITSVFFNRKFAKSMKNKEKRKKRKETRAKRQEPRLNKRLESGFTWITEVAYRPLRKIIPSRSFLIPFPQSAQRKKSRENREKKQEPRDKTK